jgi:hypothetical protein
LLAPGAKKTHLHLHNFEFSLYALNYAIFTLVSPAVGRRLPTCYSQFRIPASRQGLGPITPFIWRQGLSPQVTWPDSETCQPAISYTQELYLHSSTRLHDVHRYQFLCPILPDPTVMPLHQLPTLHSQRIRTSLLHDITSYLFFDLQRVSARFISHIQRCFNLELPHVVTTVVVSTSIKIITIGFRYSTFGLGAVRLV